MAPHSHQRLLQQLCDRTFSIYIDCSNHSFTKLLPIVIRYFIPSSGIHVRLLDLHSIEAEDHETISNAITSTLTKNGLNIQNLIAFSADNTNCNFGGKEQRGPKNVFRMLKNLNDKILPVGCSNHILHNSAQTACGMLEINVDSTIFSIISYFKGSTKRTKELSDFCDFVEVPKIF